MNYSVKTQLDQLSDVRKNYILIGTTWFDDGRPGMERLANSTMETFVQPANCLACHQPIDGNMLGTVRSNGEGAGLSHIFGVLNPLEDPRP
jgi:hypothetical protein